MRCLSIYMLALTLPLVSLQVRADDENLVCGGALKKVVSGIRQGVEKSMNGKDFKVSYLGLVNVTEKTLDYRLILNRKDTQLVYNVQLSNEDVTRCMPYASQYLF
jgi:hypothetical protein